MEAVVVEAADWAEEGAAMPGLRAMRACGDASAPPDLWTVDTVFAAAPSSVDDGVGRRCCGDAMAAWAEAWPLAMACAASADECALMCVEFGGGGGSAGLFPP